MGFSIAAPVGPIGVLCIQRTIAYGKKSGLVTGFGAATVDGFYGFVAAFGLTIISSFLIGQQFWFRLIGGLFLFYLGIKIFSSKPTEKTVIIGHKGLLYDYFSTVLLMFINPMTILSFVGVFAGLGLGSSNMDTLSAIFMVAGVIIGSILWWLILSTSVSLFRVKFNDFYFKIINKISGAIIITFALVAFFGIFYKH